MLHISLINICENPDFYNKKKPLCKTNYITVFNY